ncbi:MAG TPA: GNAT family N-acetyltransferase [Microlunatus sp.]|nr:GNAT family N-acetyltransferase [Microlunatus sp.]
MTHLVPVELSCGDLPELQRLARACLDRDGGLPMIAGATMLSSRLLRDRTMGLRLPDGTLAAATGISLGQDAATVTGMVHPTMRRRGIGERLLQWAIAQADDAALLVETESCSSDAEALYARHGLVRIFAETVMRHDLVAVPVIAPPDGVEVVPVSSASEQDLFDAYRGSFADRPGFEEPDAEEWLAELHADEEWRTDLSLLATDDRARPIGFVNVLGNWLDQVGVLPGWRGQRLGALLVSRSLRALQTEGATEMWLCVNVNNAAEDLYRRLGFTAHGTRARYAGRRQPATQ